MIRYEIRHDGRLCKTLVTEYGGADIIILNYMLRLAEKSPGVFRLWLVKRDQETGEEEHTWLAYTQTPEGGL